jgi:SPP1 gp7 family putative phage head morphogenesis protein
MMKPRVTPAERRAADLQNRDRAALERIGIAAAQQIGFRAQQAALREFRRGNDPVPAIRSQIATAVPLLAQGMLAGHLTGRKRAVLLFQQAPQPVAMSRTAYSGAVKTLQKRLNLAPDELTALEAKYEAQALRVLKSASEAVEQKLQEAALEMTEEGMHVREGVQRIAQAFDAAGLTPDNSFSLEAIFRTQTQLAYGAGRWNMDQDPAVQEILWGYKYVTVGDDRVRPEHVGLEGTQLPKDHPFWSMCWPPNGWCCRCSAISIFDERESIDPPPIVEVDGKDVIPGPDKGFGFNPGLVFSDHLPPSPALAV